jgi:hypothetical protein
VNVTDRKTFRDRCSDRGIDPDEVVVVAERYAAYRRFTPAGGLPLEAWFRFYRLEKAADVGEEGRGTVSSCSATGEGRGHAFLDRPDEFLGLLGDYLQRAGIVAGTAP